MRITFRTVQEFRALIGSDLAGFLASPDEFEVQRDRAYRAALGAGDDVTLDAPALDESDLRRNKRPAARHDVGSAARRDRALRSRLTPTRVIVSTQEWVRAPAGPLCKTLVTRRT